MPIPEPVLAGVIAASIPFLELCAWRRKFIVVRAAPWVVARLSIDGLVAAAAYPVVVNVVKGPAWFVYPWPAVFSAICGLAILRTQFALFGGVGKARLLGVAGIYQQAIARIDGCIDDVCSVAMSRWVTRAMVRIEDLPESELTRRIDFYFGALDRLTPNKAKQARDYVASVFKDKYADSHKKYETIVYYLLELGGKRLVRSLTKSVHQTWYTRVRIRLPRSRTPPDSSSQVEKEVERRTK